MGDGIDESAMRLFCVQVIWKAMPADLGEIWRYMGVPILKDGMVGMVGMGGMVGMVWYTFKYDLCKNYVWSSTFSCFRVYQTISSCEVGWFASHPLKERESCMIPFHKAMEHGPCVNALPVQSTWDDVAKCSKNWCHSELYRIKYDTFVVYQELPYAVQL